MPLDTASRARLENMKLAILGSSLPDAAAMIDMLLSTAWPSLSPSHVLISSHPCHTISPIVKNWAANRDTPVTHIRVFHPFPTLTGRAALYASHYEIAVHASHGLVISDGKAEHVQAVRALILSRKPFVVFTVSSGQLEIQNFED